MPRIDEWHTPDWNRKPPGMIWEDWQAWGPWLKGPGAAWSMYAYDIELYTQPLPNQLSDPGLLKMWMRNTAKRIDAVGTTGDQFDIFEARRFAGWSAIAQLLGYRDLFHIQFPDLLLRDLWLITEKIDDTTRATAARQGVKTWVVGEPAPRP